MCNDFKKNIVTRSHFTHIYIDTFNHNFCGILYVTGTAESSSPTHPFNPVIGFIRNEKIQGT